MASKRGRLIEELLARKWYLASVLLPLVSLCAGSAAANYDREAANTRVQAVQDFVDGETSAIPDLRHPKIRSLSRTAWRLHRMATTNLFVGLLALVISIRECEPGNRFIPALLILIAALVRYDLL